MRYVLTSIIIIIFYSCVRNNRSDHNIVHYEMFDVAEQSLSYQKINIKEAFINVDEIIISRNKLLIYNSKSPSFFSLIDLASQRVISKFGNRGPGPNEFITINDRCISYVDNTISLLDINVLKTGSILSDRNSDHFEIQERLYFPSDLMIINGLLRLSDFKLIGHSMSPMIEKEFFVYDIAEKKWSQFGEYPKLYKHSEVTPKSAKQLYMKEISIKPDLDRFCCLYNNFELLRIYSNDLKLLVESSPKETDQQRIVLYQDGIETQNAYIYYLDLCVSNNYIYGLYLGQKESFMNKNDKIEEIPTYVHIWDWEGNPVKSICLKGFYNKLAISEDDKILYVTNPFDGDNIYLFPIINVL